MTGLAKVNAIAGTKMNREIEEGMGFSGLVPTKSEKKRDAMRSEVIKIAAALARFQHTELSEIEQEDLPQFGDYANRLKKVADSL